MNLPLLPQEPSLSIVEVFASIQGETTLTGVPTTFIRLARCNLRCSWCDTDYSFGRGKPMTLEAILQKVDALGPTTVCITGGEPLLQEEVHPLMTLLCDHGYALSIETGGSLPIENIDERVKVILDVKCPGSGMEERNHWQNLDVLQQKDEVKFVLAHREDFDYALTVCRNHRLFERELTLLFSPVFDQLPAQQLVEWVLESRIPVRLNLQVHKFIWHPQTKGV